jgi:hypothetical protein
MKGVKSVVVELGILPVFVRIAGAPVEQLVIQPSCTRQGSSGSKWSWGSSREVRRAILAHSRSTTLSRDPWTCR